MSQLISFHIRVNIDSSFAAIAKVIVPSRNISYLGSYRSCFLYFDHEYIQKLLSFFYKETEIVDLVTWIILSLYMLWEVILKCNIFMCFTDKIPWKLKGDWSRQRAQYTWRERRMPL